MQIKYKFYFGGDSNPYEKDRDEAYARLTEERERADPANEKPLRELFPQLDSWPDFLIANSKAVFWGMERGISRDQLAKSAEIELLWAEAKSEGRVGEWLKKSEADESTKAMCYFMEALRERFAPDDFTVDFRYYITEGSKPRELSQDEQNFSLEAYE